MVKYIHINDTKDDMAIHLIQNHTFGFEFKFIHENKRNHQNMPHLNEYYEQIISYCSG